MYVIDLNPTFWTPVTVRNPGPAGEIAGTFRAKFKALPVSNVNQYESDEAGVRGLLTEAWIDADDLETAPKQPAVWSPELRDQLLDAPQVRAALVRAYFDAFSEAHSKN